MKSEMDKKQYKEIYEYVYGKNINEETLDEGVEKRLKKILKSPKVRKISTGMLISLIAPFIASGQDANVIKQTEGVQSLLRKVYNATGDERFKISKDSLGRMNNTAFKDLMELTISKYEQISPNAYVKGSDKYKQDKEKNKNARLIKKVNYLVPSTEFKAATIPERERFKYEFGQAVKRGLKTFIFKRDDGTESKIAVKIDPKAKPIKTSGGTKSSSKTEWKPVEDRLKNENYSRGLRKIYISENVYNQINEDEQSVDSFRAKLEGVIHHLKPFMEMSDQRLDELIHKHDWLDKKMTEIETIAKDIGHYGEYESKYFDDEINEDALNEKKEKRDRCLRIADRKYDKPSAYKSGAVVRCRKGDIWKNEK